MKAIMYGAGNIGRGFIGQKFYLSGYETVFIDVNMAVVDAINQAHEYPVYVTGKHEYVEQPVKNVRAVDGRDNDAVVREIASCDIMATALGVNVIKFVAPLIGQAIEKRFAEGGRPLNILICENMIGSNVYLHDLVSAHISDACRDYFENQICRTDGSPHAGGAGGKERIGRVRRALQQIAGGCRRFSPRRLRLPAAEGACAFRAL